MKNYNTNFYSREKALYRDNYFREKPLFFEGGADTNKVFFELILREIERLGDKSIKILDLGTGTGYVPEILCELSSANLDITGIDIADTMLKVARSKINDKRVKFVSADNREIPFANEYFDIITNKLSTQFSAKEVKRVLKDGGAFVFKEYGKYRGFREISILFQGRYKKTVLPTDYSKKFHELGFSEVLLNLFNIEREYTLEEIKKIFNMANLIGNFKNRDLSKIKSELFTPNQGVIHIISDPFILFAKK